jgi:hypothetical protein
VRAPQQPQRQALAVGRDGAALDRRRHARSRTPIDVYVLLGDFPKSGRDRFQQLDRAVALATELEADTALGQHLGRIRIIALQRDEEDAITATTELPTAPGSR